MRIVAFGSGGVGGYFGARLAAAGEDVAFIARGRHLEAMRRDGLRIVSPKGDLHLPRVRATDDPASLGPADVVLFTVKMYDADASAAQLRPLVGPDTAVITFQNGVEAVDIVARHVGAEHAVGGVAYVAAVIAEPGVIRHTALERLIFGETDGTVSPRLQALAEAGRRAAFDAVASPRIEYDLWAKFARLATFSGITSLTRLPVGPIRANAELFALVPQAIAEVVAVGQARGVPLDDAVLNEALQMMRTMPDASKSSMLEDLERGRRLELPWLSGAVVRLGREAGVPTPIHQFIATALGPWVHGAVEL
jgi:2-dehydropantoate 2-reductase